MSQNGPSQRLYTLEHLDILSAKYGVSESLSRNIIKCESGGKPYAKNVNYQDGIAWSTDIGYWQINDYFHEESLKKLGFDIHNPSDNLEAGFFLLSTQGANLWSAGSKCWLYF